MAPSISQAFATLALAGAIGCSTSGLQGNVFRQGDVAFRVGPIPDHWEQLDQEVPGDDLASFAFRDDQNGVTVGAAGRCHRDGDDVPLRSLTQHLYLGFTNRQIEHEQELRLDGRAALRTEMTASLDGVPKHLLFVVVKKDGCVYDFWHIASYAGENPEFDQFVQGFEVVQ
jgi:hypothetical protein